MRTPRALIGPAALALAIGLGTSACGTRVAETNPPIRITGDKNAAVPTTEATTTTAEPEVTTTTYFYGTTPADSGN